MLCKRICFLFTYGLSVQCLFQNPCQHGMVRELIYLVFVEGGVVSEILISEPQTSWDAMRFLLLFIYLGAARSAQVRRRKHLD